MKRDFYKERKSYLLKEYDKKCRNQIRWKLKEEIRRKERMLAVLSVVMISAEFGILSFTAKLFENSKHEYEIKVFLTIITVIVLALLFNSKRTEIDELHKCEEMLQVQGKEQKWKK